MEIREPFEIGAAGYAAERATTEDLRHLHAALDRYETTRRDDLDCLVEAEIAFHEAVIEISGNGILQELMRVFYALYRLWVEEGRIQFAVGKPRELGHRDIVAAIAARDVSSARAAMARHLSLAKQQSMAEEQQGADAVVR
jgi:DNA-binding FadR family transcriptional regulator